MKDGSYKPDSFSFKGGTGKLSISCDEIIIKGGKTYARIVFSSTYIQYVKAGGQKITDYTRGSDSTSFVIPVEHDCDLALESTMILHTPEVQEMIEDLDIPVMIDRSSYELEVLGRIEWIKLYGALVNKEDVAEEVFAAQKEIVDSMEDFENTGKTVAFFSVNSDRSVVVRKTQDIIPNMIETGGGKYVLENADDPSTNSASMNMTMEEFYSQAVNADYIVYNGTIVGALNSVDDLLGKDPLFAEFKAVKEGNVWTVDKTWYQDTANVANLITDFNVMLTDGDPSKLTYMKKVS